MTTDNSTKTPEQTCSDDEAYHRLMQLIGAQALKVLLEGKSPVKPLQPVSDQ